MKSPNIKQYWLLFFIIFFHVIMLQGQSYTLQDEDVVVSNGVILSCSDNLPSRYVVIPDSLQGQKIIGIKDSEHQYHGVFRHAELFEITLPKDIQFIGDYAFALNNLFYLHLEGMSDLKRIGKQAFVFNNLNEIYFEGCTSLEIIGKEAFSGNQMMKADFNHCINLHTIGDKAFSSNRISNMQISDCNRLTYIGRQAFYGNYLSNFKLPICTGYETFGWKDVSGNDFPGNSIVSDLNSLYYVPYQYLLSDDNLKVMNGIITECDYNFKFKCILIPEEIDGEIVRGIADGLSSQNGVFYEKCIVSAILPKTIRIIGNNAFANNSIINIDFSQSQDLEIIGLNAFSLNILKSADFSGCSNLKVIDNYAFMGHSLKSLDLNGCSSLKSIGEHAFLCKTYPEHVFNSIDISSCNELISISDRAFYNHLDDSIDLSGCISLAYIGKSSFSGDSLKGFNLPCNEDFTLNGWKNSDGVEFECDQYTSNMSSYYYVPVLYELQDSDVVIENGYITWCTHEIPLKLLSIPDILQGEMIKGIADGDSPLNGVFARRSLIGVVLPDSMEYIGDLAFSENEFSFLNFGGMTKLKSIGKRAFTSVWDIEELDLNDCTKLEYIDEEAFFGNYFDEIHLDNCISLNYIGSGAFCENGPNSFKLPVNKDHMNLGWVDWQGNHYNGGDYTESTCSVYYVPFTYMLNDDDVEINNGVIEAVSYTPAYYNIGIPDSIQEQVVKGIGDPQNSEFGIFENMNLNSLLLPSELSYIGERAFFKNSIVSGSLLSSKKLRYVGQNAFSDNNFTDIILPEPVYSGYENWISSDGQIVFGNVKINQLFSSYTAVGNTFNVEVFVKDNFNLPIELAKVYLDGELLDTDFEGSANFNSIFEGQYNCVVHYDNYASESRNLVVKKDTSFVIILDNLGVNNVKSLPIKVYPNPAKNYFTVRADFGYESVIIYNLQGIKVAEFAHNVAGTYNISELQRGIYIIRFMSKVGANHALTKLILQ